ncbi:hypothetical protein NVV95_02970 [Herbiconiux sp. CPCC 205716]|uniref:Uncharacterized protein n=1 Tax=Herbiconiux gentiana TaxID=2970912 RepID=A0ABT2GBC8_9MICO|nr:hypothetical protein [Herbiconiux gentiana]MCS5713512.1 hypothetical protein [Herbiconiux gentiana]
MASLHHAQFPHLVEPRTTTAAAQVRDRCRRACRSFILGLSIAIALSIISAPSATLAAQSPSAPVTSCRTEADAGACDVDHDRIPDVVERVVCGDLTCADGTEDIDGDGVADWVEVSACHEVRCADPARDSDDDGIPDFAETLTCGSTTCSNSRENRDGDGATDWAEVVICGDTTCASGLEDYDENGVADAAELQSCVREVTDLAFTGSVVWVAILFASGLVAGGIVLRLLRRRRSPASPDETVLESAER